MMAITATSTSSTPKHRIPFDLKIVDANRAGKGAAWSACRAIALGQATWNLCSARVPLCGIEQTDDAHFGSTSRGSMARRG